MVISSKRETDGYRIKNLPGGDSVSWENVTGKPNFATVATSGNYYDLSNKPTIPPAVTVDNAVTRTSANPVKSSGIWGAIWGALTALPTGFTALYDWVVAQLAGKLNTDGYTSWRISYPVSGYELLSCSWNRRGFEGVWVVELLNVASGEKETFNVPGAKTITEIVGQSEDPTHPLFSLVREKMCKTKTSELTNDGDGDSPFATVSQIPDISDKADAADLRYALVVAPVETTFSVPDAWFPITFTYGGTAYTVQLMDKDMIVVNDGYLEYHGPNGEFVSMAYFNGAVLNVIAPGVSSLQFNGVVPVEGETALEDTHTAALTDRASNRVTPADASALTLTLPAAVPGYMRDLIVRLDLTALATAPEVTFAAPTGETVKIEAEDGAMPELEAGKVNLVSLTETDTGKIDVAHKTMQEVE